MFRQKLPSASELGKLPTNPCDGGKLSGDPHVLTVRARDPRPSRGRGFDEATALGGVVDIPRLKVRFDQPLGFRS